MSANELHGFKVIFEENNREKVLLLDEVIGTGATSSIWLGNDSSGRKFAIKVPNDVRFIETEFLDERDVIKRIAAKQEEMGMVINVPRHFIGKIEGKGTEALILEYIPIEKQWLLESKSDPEFLSKGIFEAAAQANELFKTTYQLGILNQDVKIENFYWFEDESRFVFLDWNRCIAVSDQPENYQSLRDALVTFIYESITGETPPEPLPPLDSVGPGLWDDEVSRPVRRMLYHMREGGLNFDTIDYLLKWQKDLLSLPFIPNALANKIREIINSPQYTPSEKKEFLLDIKDLILQHKEYREENYDNVETIDQFIQQYDTGMTNTSATAQIETVRLLLKRVQPTRAKEILKTITMDSENQKIDNDVLFKEWFAACLVADWLQKYGLVSAEEVEDVMRCFDNHLGSDQIHTKSESEAFVRSQYDLFLQSEKLISEAEEINKIPYPAAKKQAIEDFNKKVIAHLDNIPIETRAYFEPQIPNWDLNLIEREIQAMEAEKAKSDVSSGLKDQIRSLLIGRTTYPKDEIDRLLIESNINILHFRDLSAIKLLNLNLENQSYSNALKIARALSEFPRIEEKVVEYVLEQFEIYEKLTLYAADIRRIDQALNLVPESHLMGKETLRNLRQRVEFAKRADYTLQEDLDRCEALNIEPWAMNGKTLPLLVSSLKGFTQIASMQKEVIESQRKLNSRAPEEEINTLYAVYDTVHQQLDELNKQQDSVASVQEIVNEKSHTINTLIEQAKSGQADLEMMKGRLIESIEVMQPLFEKINSIKLSDFPVPTKMENEVFFITWLDSILMSGTREAFRQAANSAAEYINQTKTRGEESHMVQAWLRHLLEINGNYELQNNYLDWINGIRSRDSGKSANAMRKLKNEQGTYLYDQLVSKYRSNFGSQNSNEEKFSQLFLNGQIDQLETLLTSTISDSAYDELQIAEWNYRIKMVRNLRDYYENQENTLGQFGEIIGEIIKMYAPDYYFNIISPTNRIRGMRE